MLASLVSSGYATFALALVGVWVVLGTGRRLNERRVIARQQRALDAGAAEPVSLHPIIDPARCVGCGACTKACPEGRIIGLIAGKAELVDPASCIGHGACKTACPVSAIELVFGSARRGVDIPLVSPEFETNVPGIFIAGELGGMGLIANAIEQGRQSIDVIAKRQFKSSAVSGVLDVVIVGAGPAGISATLAAREKGLNALTLEQDTLGGTVAHYPRKKLVMTRAATLPLYGKVRLKRVRKEQLLSLWQSVISKTGVTIHFGVSVERITQINGLFSVTTPLGSRLTRNVLLATGRRGAPKKLGVPGENLEKVAYRLADPKTYRGQHVLVVGGGDSATEAALELSRHPVASVTLSCRSSRPSRVRPENARRFEEARRAGRIYCLSNSRVQAIEHDRVVIDQIHNDQTHERHILANTAVIVAIGGTLPVELLTNAGVRSETRFGTA